MVTIENFALYILRSLEANPDKVLLRVKEKKESFSDYTGSEIRQEVNSRLFQLKRRPAEAVIFIPFGSDHIFWTIALMLRGVTVLDLPIKNLRQELITGPPRTIILPAEGHFFLRLLFRLQGSRVLRSHKKGGGTDLKIDSFPQHPAVISYSSGSKGLPKKFDRSHHSLIQHYLALKSSFPHYGDQIDFPLFPFSVLHNLALGVCTVLPPIDWNHWEKFFAGDMLDSMAQEHVSSVAGNVFYFYKLLRSARSMNYVLNDVKEVRIGGSPAPEWILADLQATFPNAKVFILYGTTEAEPIAIREYKRRRDPLLGYCVGTPHPDITIKLDKKGSFKRDEKTFDWGEICVSGPHVNHNKSKILHTGDMGYLFDGELYLIGRKDNKIPLGDYFPFQIEHFLVDQLDVQDVAVLIAAEGLRIYYEANNDEDVAIENCIRGQFGSIPFACKRIYEIPKDERHHSKTLYSKLDENVLE